MRILHVIDTSGIGGAQSLLRGILEHECETDHRAFVLRRHRRELLHTSDRIEIFPSTSKFSVAPRARLHALLREQRFDVLHCHLPRSELFAATAPGRLRKSAALIAHEHGQILGSDDQGLLPDLAYGSMKRVLRGRFDHHIAVSNQAKDALMSRLGVSEDAITVIPSFFDTGEFNNAVRLQKRADLRAADGISDDEFVIGIAGRIIAKKGWKVFLQALHDMKQSGDVPRVVVTGDGPERPEFEQLVSSYELTERIIDIHWVDDIRDFYSRLDCFIAPSYAEGSPVAAREAMAMGLPIIASTASGFRDLIEDGRSGLLFEIGDSAALARKIGEVASSDELRSTLAAGATASAERFSVAHYQNALDDVYRGVLERRLR